MKRQQRVYEEADVVPVWIADVGVEPVLYVPFSVQGTNDGTPEIVAFERSNLDAKLSCNGCALKNTEGCKAFKCENGAYVAKNIYARPYRISDNQVVGEYDGKPLEFRNEIINPPPKAEPIQIPDPEYDETSARKALKWEGALLELDKQARRAEFEEAQARARAKELQKRIKRLRSKIGDLLVQGSENYQPDEPLFELLNEEETI